MGDRLDREAMERVLRRAQELAWEETSDPDEAGVVDEEILIEAAGEAGIDPAAVRRALALERLVFAAEEQRSDIIRRRERFRPRGGSLAHFLSGGV